jgi:hypothetical protein
VYSIRLTPCPAKPVTESSTTKAVVAVAKDLFKRVMNAVGRINSDVIKGF